MASPATTSPAMMTLRPLNRSNNRPTKGWVMPLIKKPVPTAADSMNRDQPNSSSKGMMKIPKLLRAPVVTKATNTVAAHTYQP